MVAFNKSNFERDLELNRLCAYAYRAGGFTCDKGAEEIKDTKINSEILRKRISGKIPTLKELGDLTEKEQVEFQALKEKYRGCGKIPKSISNIDSLAYRRV